MAMNRTKIEWAKNPDGTPGYTWNPITGCLNGCDYCYAKKLANGRLRERYLANKNIARSGYPIPKRLDELPMDEDNPFYPRFWPERLKELEDRASNNNRFHKPIGVFVCDMGELFGDWVPEAWTRRVLEAISKQMIYPAEPDRFYLLTKQPQNLPKWSPFPGNCWVGVTATNTRMALEACLKLGDIEAPIRYLSIEPMLNPINLPPEHLKVCKIAQIIIGAQTKPYKPPRIEWVQEIVKAANQAGIPVFLKDNLYPIFNVETEIDATRLHKDYPWAFKEYDLAFENEKISATGRATYMRQELPV